MACLPRVSTDAVVSEKPKPTSASDWPAAPVVPAAPIVPATPVSCRRCRCRRCPRRRRSSCRRCPCRRCPCRRRPSCRRRRRRRCPCRRRRSCRRGRSRPRYRPRLRAWSCRWTSTSSRLQRACPTRPRFAPHRTSADARSSPHPFASAHGPTVLGPGVLDHTMCVVRFPARPTWPDRRSARSARCDAGVRFGACASCTR